MGRTTVSYSASDWVYSPLKYWPTDKDLVFYAYDKVMEWNGIPTDEATYTAPNGKEAGIDALVTKTGALNTPGVKVPLVFHHALSQVLVSARSGYNTVNFEIKKVTLTNVLPNGKVTLWDGVQRYRMLPPFQVMVLIGQRKVQQQLMNWD